MSKKSVDGPEKLCATTVTDASIERVSRYEAMLSAHVTSKTRFESVGLSISWGSMQNGSSINICLLTVQTAPLPSHPCKSKISPAAIKEKSASRKTPASATRKLLLRSLNAYPRTSQMDLSIPQGRRLPTLFAAISSRTTAARRSIPSSIFSSVFNEKQRRISFFPFPST